MVVLNEDETVVTIGRRAFLVHRGVSAKDSVSHSKRLHLLTSVKFVLFLYVLTLSVLYGASLLPERSTSELIGGLFRGVDTEKILYIADWIYYLLFAVGLLIAFRIFARALYKGLIVLNYEAAVIAFLKGLLLTIAVFSLRSVLTKLFSITIFSLLIIFLLLLLFYLFSFIWRVQVVTVSLLRVSDEEYSFLSEVSPSMRDEILWRTSGKFRRWMIENNPH